MPIIQLSEVAQRPVRAPRDGHGVSHLRGERGDFQYTSKVHAGVPQNHSVSHHMAVSISELGIQHCHVMLDVEM